MLPPQMLGALQHRDQPQVSGAEEGVDGLRGIEAAAIVPNGQHDPCSIDSELDRYRAGSSVPHGVGKRLTDDAIECLLGVLRQAQVGGEGLVTEADRNVLLATGPSAQVLQCRHQPQMSKLGWVEFHTGYAQSEHGIVSQLRQLAKLRDERQGAPIRRGHGDRRVHVTHYLQHRLQGAIMNFLGGPLALGVLHME